MRKAIKTDMETSIKLIREDIVGLKKDLEFIKNVLKEDYELSDSAKLAVKKARETPKEKYIRFK